MIDHEMLRLNLRHEDRFYWQMVLIRTFEARLLDLFKDNQIFGTTHTSIGQEADAVAVVGALDRERDTIWSNHRCHGHFLAYCGQLTGLAAEILGRDGGVCRGARRQPASELWPLPQQRYPGRTGAARDRHGHGRSCAGRDFRGLPGRRHHGRGRGL
ncbi:MAG: hypothetical protein HC871_15670 [Rhizobiales bacterium]|nr:hypothetical protein [Hyphomicrobiales bacterium]